MIWCVVTTKPNAERRAAREIEAQGLSVVAPTYRRVSRHSRRTIERIEPHMRRYICVAADADTIVWEAISSANHADRPLMSGDRIARIRPAEVDRLRALDDVAPVQPLSHTLQAGQMVQILEGPFAGLKGPITYAGRDLIRVETCLFGRQTELPLNPSAVRSV